MLWEFDGSGWYSILNPGKNAKECTKYKRWVQITMTEIGQFEVENRYALNERQDESKVRIICFDTFKEAKEFVEKEFPNWTEIYA